MKNLFGSLAIAVGIGALLFAITPIYFADSVAPPAKGLDEHVVDLATRIEARAAAKAKGHAYVAPPEMPDPRAKWTGRMNGTATVLGILGAAFAAVSFIRRENRRVYYVATGFAVAAIAIPFMMLAVGMVAAAIVVAAVVAAVGSGGL